ncbi:MAG TPA: 1,4-alpha-glucan branching protein GlgB [Acidimicrobiales bacterium]|nr:1,4-alpha-glucan branching protein GlgB [Acidimicrobiales bacterium]
MNAGHESDDTPNARKASGKRATGKKAGAAKKASAGKQDVAGKKVVATEPAAERDRAGLIGDLDRLVRGEHADPHHVLGAHRSAGGVVVRGHRPDAKSMTLVLDGGRRLEMEQIHDGGVFAVDVPPSDLGPDGIGAYQLEVVYGDGQTYTLGDPYRFWPTLGELDIHLFAEGRHERLWEVLGARVREHQGQRGTSFSVWAPTARSVRVVGDFNGWDGRLHPMRTLGSSGVWELFLPDVGPGARYKLEILTQGGHLRLKADPMAFAAEHPPETSSVVVESSHEWGDLEWLERRRSSDPLHRPMSTYEVHLGSWRTVPEEGDRPLTYREMATALVDHVADLGFTHVELMPPTEHPYTPSWGYQVSSYFAPTSRFGSPDDFRALVDAFHARGIGVIVDWVPAHFPKDDWALARFDGTALYEHEDPRQGEHPDWGTLVFNFGRPEVRNFLMASALYWVEELHVDGLRVDAVASMLYLDYSREEGQWVPNIHGGRENLEAVSFLQEVNTVMHGRYPGVMTIAEESTAWPGVSRPVYVGGLGFGHKWNMGWMHDTLEYFSKDPIHRRFHHHQLTFGLIYAFSENFVLPLSHDEVVHGKGSLLTKMPGDRWQQLANLRALYGWMWAHPGKPLIFMGCEIAQEQEWSEARSLDWHLLDDPGHAGIRDLVHDLNTLHSDEPALWTGDFEPSGFQWIDANDADQSCYSFLRTPVGDAHADARPVACVANLTPVPRYGYRVGLPEAGAWEVLLNTDATCFGGSGVDVGPVLDTEERDWHGHDHSTVLTIPPLGVVWLAPQR